MSERSDDAISEEVLEMLGWDEMDLVSEILQDRHQVGQEVNFLFETGTVLMLTPFALSLSIWKQPSQC